MLVRGITMGFGFVRGWVGPGSDAGGSGRLLVLFLGLLLTAGVIL